MKIQLKHFKGILWVFAFLLLWATFFIFIDPKTIVSSIGVNNSYLILFFIALIGGASSFTSSSYYAAIVTFALSGLNPLGMAVCAGVGLTIGDSIFYGLGSIGRKNISGKVRVYVEKYSNWLAKKPKRIIQLITYIYTGMLPLPGDILMIILSFSRFPFKSFIIPVLLGNMTMVLLIALGVLVGGRLL